MIVTLCVKCRCATMLVTEPVTNTKTVLKDITKFVAIICSACDATEDDINKYHETITPSDVISMQEWKYIVERLRRQGRTLNINTVGDHIVVFNRDKVISPATKIVSSNPIVTCKQHHFHVHD